MIKELTKNHKFMIEYVILEDRPSSAEEAVSSIHGHSVQMHKMYIATKGSSAGSGGLLGNSSYTPQPRDMDVVSNAYSYRTAKE